MKAWKKNWETSGPQPDLMVKRAGRRFPVPQTKIGPLLGVLKVGRNFKIPTCVAGIPRTDHSIFQAYAALLFPNSGRAQVSLVTSRDVECTITVCLTSFIWFWTNGAQSRLPDQCLEVTPRGPCSARDWVPAAHMHDQWSGPLSYLLALDQQLCPAPPGSTHHHLPTSNYTARFHLVFILTYRHAHNHVENTTYLDTYIEHSTQGGCRDITKPCSCMCICFNTKRLACVYMQGLCVYM